MLKNLQTNKKLQDIIIIDSIQLNKTTRLAGVNQKRNKIYLDVK